MLASKAKAYLSKSTFLVCHSKEGYWTYPQTFDKAGKACQEQTL
jgi:hypothetical protein